MSTTPLDRAEFQALAQIAKARRENARRLLGNAHLEWGKWAREKSSVVVLKTAAQIGYGASDLARKVGDVAISQSNLQETGKEFLSLCSGIHSASDLGAALTSETLQKTVAEIAPLIGILTSGYSSVQAWRAVVQSGYSLYQDNRAKLDILPGDAQAAAEAIITLLERRLANESVNAARNTAVLAAKIAGLFADLGTGTNAALGLANSAAALLQELASIGLDYSEMKAGNKLLDNPSQIDLQIFKACPILGCYILIGSDTSSVLNFFVADIGLPNWMDRIELMKRTSLDRLTKDANNFIIESRIHLEGMVTTKGIKPEVTFFQKIKNGFHKLIKSKA